MYSRDRDLQAFLPTKKPWKQKGDLEHSRNKVRRRGYRVESELYYYYKPHSEATRLAARPRLGAKHHGRVACNMTLTRETKWFPLRATRIIMSTFFIFFSLFFSDVSYFKVACSWLMSSGDHHGLTSRANSVAYASCRLRSRLFYENFPITRSRTSGAFRPLILTCMEYISMFRSKVVFRHCNGRNCPLVWPPNLSANQETLETERRSRTFEKS